MNISTLAFTLMMLNDDAERPSRDYPDMRRHYTRRENKPSLSRGTICKRHGAAADAHFGRSLSRDTNFFDLCQAIAATLHAPCALLEFVMRDFYVADIFALQVLGSWIKDVSG